MLKIGFKKVLEILCQKPRQARDDIVIIFPFQDKKILIIKEYRKDLDTEIWKFVSGGMDKSHLNSLETAKEELAEEIKMECNDWSLYHQFDKEFSSVNIFYFIATNPQLMKKPIKNPDEDDIIVDQKWVNLEELWAMIDEKEIIWKESVLVAVNFLRQNN